MKNIISSEPCPECRRNGRDRTGNHLMVFADGNKLCKKSEYHSNGLPFFISTNPNESGGEDIFTRDSVEDINNYPFDKLESRCIPKGVCEIYGVRVSYSESTREVDSHYYPRYNSSEELVGYKIRRLPKEFTIVGKKERPILFGQWVTSFRNNRKIVITGGEEDALASYTMTGQNLNSPIPAVSPPDGENFTCFESPVVLNFLKGFEVIYLALDNDDSGQKLTKKLIDLLGVEKVRLLVFSEKDVSDMLTKGKKREYIDAILSAKEYKPSGIVKVSDLDDSVVEKTQWGLSYPFPSLTRMTYGARVGEVIGIGAAPGAGKTTFIRKLQKHFIFEHKEKIAVFSLEEGVDETTKGLVGSVMMKPIHLPDCEYDVEKAKEIKRSFGDYLYLFNCEEYHDWNDIVSGIRYFASIGVKYIFIDPLSALVAHLPPSEANTWLNTNMFRFEKMAKTLGITFYHTNHLNNPTTGKDHGAGGRVYGSQFSGSRAQWKFSTSLWGLERDQLDEDSFKKNIVRLSSIKSRMSGDTSGFLMVYKKETGTLEEDDDMVKRIIGG